MEAFPMCGVVGAYSLDGENVMPSIAVAAQMLQNRGGLYPQGVGISNGREVYRSENPPYQFFPEILGRMNGHIGQAGLRYGTEGDRTGISNCPPIVVRHKENAAHFVHNGNVPYSDVLHRFMEDDGYQHRTTTDTESMAAFFLKQIRESADIEEAAGKFMRHLEDAAYSNIILLPEHDALLAMRDPAGYRPLFMGRKNGTYIFASEDPAIASEILPEKYRFDQLTEVEPGELVIVNRNGMKRRRLVEGVPKSLCSFEYAYFARPDTTLNANGIPLRVALARYRLGEKLHELYPVHADVIVPDSESGDYAAMGLSRASGIPYVKAMPKERYSVPLHEEGISLGQRGFMTESDGKRKFVASHRLLLEEFVIGRRIGYTTDSVVRGTTVKENLALLRRMGAKEAHVRVSYPPIKFPCHKGIDYRGVAQLVTRGVNTDDIGYVNEYLRNLTGADSWGYMTREGLREVLGSGICMQCLGEGFDGTIRIPEFLEKHAGQKTVVML